MTVPVHSNHGWRLFKEAKPIGGGGRRLSPDTDEVLKDQQLEMAAAHAAPQQLRCLPQGTREEPWPVPDTHGALCGQSLQGYQ